VSGTRRTAAVCYHKQVKFKETQKRSITKSLTFRVIVVTADFIIMYIITRHVGVTIVLTVFTNLTSTVLYFLHERLWNGVAWGKQRIR
jgi:uncharacterized membrane protein